MTAPPSLRTFGFILAAFLALVFGTVFPLVGWLRPHLWIWAVAAAIALLAAARPATLRPVHAAWMAMGRVLGWINTRLLLGVAFFGVIWPLGALRAALGGRSIAARADPGAASYRVVRDPGAKPVDFGKPY